MLLPFYIYFFPLNILDILLELNKLQNKIFSLSYFLLLAMYEVKVEFDNSTNPKT